MSAIKVFKDAVVVLKALSAAAASARSEVQISKYHSLSLHPSPYNGIVPRIVLTSAFMN